MRDLKVGKRVPAGFCALRDRECGGGGGKRTKGKHLEDPNFVMRNGGEGLGNATEYLKEREQGDERPAT